MSDSWRHLQWFYFYVASVGGRLIQVSVNSIGVFTCIEKKILYNLSIHRIYSLELAALIVLKKYNRSHFGTTACGASIDFHPAFAHPATTQNPPTTNHRLSADLTHRTTYGFISIEHVRNSRRLRRICKLSVSNPISFAVAIAISTHRANRNSRVLPRRRECASIEPVRAPPTPSSVQRRSKEAVQTKTSTHRKGIHTTQVRENIHGDAASPLFC